MYKRVVVKVGSKVLANDVGHLDATIIQHLIDQIATIRAQGTQIILISSGAVASGREIMHGTEDMPTSQVLAALGQPRLMQAYTSAASAHDILCAQILVTKEDFRDSVHYRNMRTCFEHTLVADVLPVVNENDTVATTELLFTDNDELAGMVASLVGAEKVIILSSIPGFIAGDISDPRSPVIHEIDFSKKNEYQSYVSTTKTASGRGGMRTKWAIARKLTLQGIDVHIAPGRTHNILLDCISNKAIGTRFLAQRHTHAPKRQIAYSEGLTKGSIRLNECTTDLIKTRERIMSILPIGVTAVHGSFEKGDVIEILGDDHTVLGYGITRMNTKKVQEVMGTKGARPIIHYDYMFIDV